MSQFYYFILLLLMISGSAFGENTGRIYLNLQKDPCPQSNACYSRIILQDPTTPHLYLIQDYHMDESLQAAFQVSCDIMLIDWKQYKKLAFHKKIKRNGFYRIWYPNGQLKYEAQYENNKVKDAPKYWLNNGERAFAPQHFKLDQPAYYPGGEEKIDEYLQKNIHLTSADNKGTCRKLYIDVAINRKGKVCYAEAQNSVDPQFDAEVVRLIQNMPNWSPAKMNGKKINTICTLPICF